LSTIELIGMLGVAEAMAHSALARRESRGAHMRLDGFEARDDVNFLKHSLALYQGEAAPRIEYGPVTITRMPPRARVYGGAGEKAQLS
jgi:fumarate reductase flavoprotein subunit